MSSNFETHSEMPLKINYMKDNHYEYFLDMHL